MVQGVERIGGGAQSYYGAVRQSSMALTDDENLALVIDTHSDPTGSGVKNTQIPQAFAKKISEILSTDLAKQEKHMMDVLNRAFQSMGVTAQDYDRALNRAQSAMSDKKAHPDVMLEFASRLLRDNKSEEYESVEDLLYAATLPQEKVLKRIIQTLEQPNEGIDVDIIGEDAPIIIVSGRNLPLAIEKLCVAHMGVSFDVLPVLRDDLENFAPNELRADTEDKIEEMIGQISRIEASRYDYKIMPEIMPQMQDLTQNPSEPSA